jgi:hypothetical protein
MVMSQHLLLTGAGFSKNWGGWLATEAFEYLLGVPELQQSPEVMGLLWDHHRTGGFEGALAALQTAAKQSPDPYKPQLVILQAAVRKMFADMNAAFLGRSVALGPGAAEFLVRFDAIFTLNQDMLLERRYSHSGQFPAGGGPKGWSGATLPGVRSPFTNFDPDPVRWQNERWRVEPELPKPGVGPQPIFKLHGSSQWYRDDDQDGVLVLGGAKAGAIASDPLLRWYLEEFERRLMQPDTRLMVIGYSFLDDHINRIIRAAGKKGLKVFVVDPRGLNVWTTRPNDPIQPGDNNLRDMLIGASRSLFQALSEGSAEYGKFQRFFEE